MIINLEDSIANLVDSQTIIEVPGNTVGEGLQQLCNIFPQLLVNILSAEKGIRLYIIVNDDLLVDSVEDLELSAETLTLGLLPAGDFHFMVTWLAWSLKIGGYILMLVGMCVPAVWWLGIIGGLVVAVSDIMLAMLHGSGGILNGGSATYSFSNIGNTTVSGVTLPVIYGEHRIGGQMLNVYTQGLGTLTAVNNVNVTQTMLFAQYGLCEGEVTSVSDVLIAGNPSTFYSDIYTAPVTDYVRVGTPTQDIMPAFSATELTNTLNYRVINMTTVPVPPTITTHVVQNAYGYVLQSKKYRTPGSLTSGGDYTDETDGVVNGYFVYSPTV